MDHIVVYDPGSPCALRVRVVLLEKGLLFATP
jgi:glutathione S-transferase